MAVTSYSPISTPLWGCEPRGCGSPELTFQGSVFRTVQIATQLPSSVKANSFTSHLLPHTTRSGPNPLSPLSPLTPASLAKHNNYTALLSASKASPGSHPALAALNLRPGCLLGAEDNTQGTSSPTEHANYSLAGTPGPGRAADPIQLRVA